MIPVDQTQFGERGNCMAACLASILELPIEDVPQFAGPDRECWRELHRWLDERSMFYLEVKCSIQSRMHFGHHVIAGRSPRNADLHHACVGLNGKIVHDPHPSRAGLAGTPPDWLYGFIIRRL